MGFAVFSSQAPQPTYREFVANAVYNTGDIPDTVLIVFAITSGTGVHVGSTCTLDDLAYGPASVGVKQVEGGVPGFVALEQNFPNPFNPTTTIQFQIPEARFVTLKVYNLLGQEVSTLVDDMLQGGRYRAEFDTGSLPSGMYFCRLQAGESVEIRKMSLLK